jgi:exoribonuclease II
MIIFGAKSNDSSTKVSKYATNLHSMTANDFCQVYQNETVSNVLHSHMSSSPSETIDTVSKLDLDDALIKHNVAKSDIVTKIQLADLLCFVSNNSKKLVNNALYIMSQSE